MRRAVPRLLVPVLGGRGTHSRSGGKRLYWMGFTLILAVACGRVPAGTAGTNSPSPTTVGSPTANPTAGWKSYVSAKWGYSIKYPADWLDLSNLGAGESEQYFANENVGGPDYMDGNGIFVAVSVYPLTGNPGLGEPRNSDECLQHEIAGIKLDRQDNVAVDGVSATINAFVREGTAELVVNLVNTGTCYWFRYLFHSTELRDSTEPNAKQMLASFRFHSSL